MGTQHTCKRAALWRFDFDIDNCVDLSCRRRRPSVVFFHHRHHHHHRLGTLLTDCHFGSCSLKSMKGCVYVLESWIEKLCWCLCGFVLNCVSPLLSLSHTNSINVLSSMLKRIVIISEDDGAACVIGWCGGWVCRATNCYVMSNKVHMGQISYIHINKNNF